ASFGDKGSRAAAVPGLVVDDNRGVEEMSERHTPTGFGVRLDFFIGHGGIADEPYFDRFLRWNEGRQQQGKEDEDQSPPPGPYSCVANSHSPGLSYNRLRWRSAEWAAARCG